MRFAIVAVLCLLTSLTYGQNRFLPVDGERVGIKGVNLPWFDGAYGHDFGRGVQGWRPSYTREKAEVRFSDIGRMDANVMRVWVFQGGCGIAVDSDGYADHINPQFLRNLKEAIEIADRHGVNCYLCISNTVRIGGKNIITNSKARSAFLRNIVIPFTREMSSNSGVFAFDLMNEPESKVKGDGCWGNACSWEQMRSFLKASAATVHRTDRGRLVSVGASGDYTIGKGYYLGLGLDFFDYHMYRDDGHLVHVNKIRNKWLKGRKRVSRRELNLPILIGECAQNNGPDARSDDELQKKAVSGFLNNARSKGYAGALIWSYEWPGAPSEKEWDRLLKGDGDATWRPAAYEIQRFKF